MNRQFRKFWSLVLSASLVAPGCAPQQPFYCREDGDLSHYLDVATEIEYPDVEEPSLDEVTNTLPPLTLKNTENYEIWDLSLEEAVQITLCNSQVMRQLGGQSPSLVSARVPETISRTLVSPVRRDDDVRSGAGGNGDRPVGRLAVPRLRAGSRAQRIRCAARCQRVLGKEPPAAEPPVRHRPQIRPDIFAQELATFRAGITKTTADGTTFGFRNNTNVRRQQHSGPRHRQSSAEPAVRQRLADEFRSVVQPSVVARRRRAIQPHRRSVQLRSVLRPGSAIPIDGVMIARIRTDQTLADFEGGVRNLVRDVEDAYWELYFAYRDLEARKMGRDSALETWKKTAALYRASTRGRQCRPRGPGSLAILPVPRPGRAGAHRGVPRRKRVAVHHGPVDVRRPADSAVR